ncbi:hypothetical protein Poly51_28570 [Rubripirellula tenax]|uniref:Uncharacterized protein n=1 Tax=Rubripirellula tenax TaxID=2528015 RepID=A0A5C6F6E7_9BACT|nr:hypothetical protein [Rubripirellula tenax]TWU56938.1 hypothetical protein Poly51_28570 [Rubripirellula tenax]
MSKRIGMVGTGFIAGGVSRLVKNHHPDLSISQTLTRRSIRLSPDLSAQHPLTNSIEELIDNCDLVFECSGDPVYATEVVDAAFSAGLPVVTMNAEFHVTTGSYFASRGHLTEAEGDQPGCLAKLREDMLQMGFEPLVYGNMKGFMNHYPKREEMEMWSKRQGIAHEQTTSFTDGTKLQIEQVLIGNASGATIVQQGMVGIESDETYQAASQLGALADKGGRPIADYILSRTQVPGVFITAKHDAIEQDSLRYYKLGDGPYYTLIRNYHLCAFEVVKTIRRTLSGGPILLNNSVSPTLSVAAVAKVAMPKGEHIVRATGGFLFRGEAVDIASCPDHVPIGILAGARLKRSVEPKQILTWDDVELKPSKAAGIASSIFQHRNASLGAANGVASMWPSHPSVKS